ncbi:MAG: flagellar basal body rod protein FlgC [candidate division KSB1 bacterium]|nr:flagellar basal body rod protein FlgC [candidate division KSB1 bacterium]
MALRGIFSAIDISSSGLSAQRRKLNVVASNIANAETTRTETGGPYRRRLVQFSQAPGSTFATVLRRVVGKLTTTHPRHIPLAAEKVETTWTQGQVEAQETVDNSQFRLVYDPGHPDADRNGYVAYPNVNIVTEMVDLITASRAYEANLAAINAAKDMAKRALEI